MSCFDFGLLNREQKEAVLCTEGPVLIIAGPGTGKTFTLVKRISYLIREKGITPGQIMVVTFTEKAGRELLTRISNELIDLNLNINEMYIGTFHAVCLRLLKENLAYAGSNGGRDHMLDAFEQTYLVCRNIEYFNRLGGYSKYIPVQGTWKQAQEICRLVNQLMEEMVDIDAMLDDFDEDMRFLAKLVKSYLDLLEKNRAMDFSSIQTKTYQMLIDHKEVLENIRDRIRYVMVDEYQDTNYIQEQLVFELAGNRKNICVVGDDDQGMYRFRGATIRNILEFPMKFDEGECRVIHLDLNYRSEPGIIDFYNRWMENPDGINLFNWDKYRYPKTIRAGKERQLADPSVYSCGGDSIDEEKRELFRMVQTLKSGGIIKDYNQVAFLFRSVKSREAMQLGAWFEENGIPVYSPRSDMFFERPEVKQILGCLLMCFQSYLMDLKRNMFLHRISDNLRTYYIECLKSAKPLLQTSHGLEGFIDRTRRSIQEIRTEADYGLTDLFYRLIAFEPFKSILFEGSQDTAPGSRPARNLAEISGMLSRFSYLHDMHLISPDNQLAMPEELFNIYLKYMYEDGVGEYEDESEYAPSGCISFMTIHQSKGLEFPVVVVGSLGNAPRRNRDPLMYSAESRFFHRRPFEPVSDIKYFDFWRLYYTAFSRAQNMLVLAAGKSDSKYFGEHLEMLPDVVMFNGSQPFEDVKTIRYKHVYSFTTHIAVYDECPVRYRFYKDLGFAKGQILQASVGSLIHATLEDMNKCIIAGCSDDVNEESIKEWFEINYRRMQEETGRFLTDGQRENALQQVLHYYHHRKDELGRVWKAEEEISLVLPDYILKGVIDLVEGQGDTVEIVDYKTGPKPDVMEQPERVEHYRKQLEVYAWLIEKRYGRKVSRMHLYYTSCLNGDPLISFDWTREAIDRTVEEISGTVRNIESRNYGRRASHSYACIYCDMRYACGKAQAV